MAISETSPDNPPTILINSINIFSLLLSCFILLVTSWLPQLQAITKIPFFCDSPWVKCSEAFYPLLSEVGAMLNSVFISFSKASMNDLPHDHLSLSLNVFSFLTSFFTDLINFI
ncbi:hypothetical protein ES705_36057 [subsurface metagenome]